MLGQFGVRQKHAAGAEKRASGLAWRHALLRHRLFYRHVHLYRLSRLSPSTLVRIVSLVVSLEGLSRRLTLVRIVSLTCTRRCTRGWYAGATAATVQQCPLYISYMRPYVCVYAGRKGRLACWGSNSHGQTDVPPALLSASKQDADSWGGGGEEGQLVTEVSCGRYVHDAHTRNPSTRESCMHTRKHSNLQSRRP